LTPATSSNFSMRLDDAHAAITISGRDKATLTPDDIMVIDMQGRAVGTSAKPSAETALHTQIYARFPETSAVLHTHSRTQTVASRLFADARTIRLEGYELLKAIAGHSTHQTRIDVPVFPNTQDMPELVARVDAWIDDGKPLYGYLIDGHGIYTWGRNMAEAERHIEAFEFLLGCELDLRRLRT
jgi:methylthioribulose-1-phosphate dehydratase